MKIDPRVYIYDENDHELEVDMELLEDGYEYGLRLTGPTMGEEVRLTDNQMAEARDKYMLLISSGATLLVDEYESAKYDYHSDY